jgi:transposase
VAKAGLRKTQRYSPEFKLTAVRLSQQPGIQVQAVAAALDIHPFMLSKWRKEVRLGILRGKGEPRRSSPVREIRRLQELERNHALLLQEHELLKKAIRFCSARRLSGLPSSRASGTASR